MVAESPPLAPLPFFEARRSVFPKAVDGPFRRFKWVVMALTLSIYYLTPWLRWDRGPYAPDQAVLVDFAHRRFYMFQIEIWPHEFYYVAGLLVMAGIGLFLVTSAVGRAWCGYACPQTVWTDLFVHVERAIDGDRNAQMRLKAAPWSAGKLGKRVTKYAVWLVIAMLTGGAWIFYFADAPALARDFATGTAPMVAYATVGVLTFTTFTLGGFMREQVCIYMCPWPRIQTAMLDEQSLVVTYKAWRGEPRSHGLKRAAATAPVATAAADPASVIPALAATLAGDCIDCDACVAVCPTGIDIREGPQIGCITCGLCIDACDKVMARIGKPAKLIGYTTLLDERIAIAGGAPKPVLKRLIRPRSVLYFLIWAGIGAGMLFAVGNRARLDLSVGRDRNPLWVQLSDGGIRNSYTVNVRNMEHRPRRVRITVEGLPGAEVWTEAGSRAAAAKSVDLRVPSDQVLKARLFVAAPGAGEKQVPLTFRVTAQDEEGGQAQVASVFERPGDAR